VIRAERPKAIRERRNIAHLILLVDSTKTIHYF
jgi:hypothetical protein